jgi:ATP-binding cassette, subfamily C, bacterial CydC
VRRASRRTGPLRRLLALAAPFAGRMVLAAFLAAATVASSIGLMTISADLISRAALHPSISELSVAIVGVRFFGIARGILRYLERLVSHDVTFRLLARLRAWFYQALEPLAPARLMQYRSGDLLARMVADVETLQDFFLRGLAPPAAALLVAALAAWLLGRFDARLAWLLLLFLFLAGVVVPFLARALGRHAGKRIIVIRSELNGALVDGIQGAPDLLVSGAEGRHLGRVREASRALSALQLRMASVSGLSAALNGFLMNLATLAVLAVAISLVDTGGFEGVHLALLAMAVISTFEVVLPLAPALQYLENSLEAGRRLFEIVDAPPEVGDPPLPLPLPAPGSCSLSARDLRFAYGPGMPPVLDGVSFDLTPGSRLAVVGPSGAGKSTLAHLLLRFWDYQGSILLDGRELRDYGQEDWRRHVAVVSQHTHLFNASIRDNLLLARPEAGEAEMVEAARRAQIHEFVESLPEGYDTFAGELGHRLSGGQRQRLAIARALLKSAPILVLDEPTADLDALTEKAVMNTLLPLMQGRTTLLITHRLTALEAVDEILVLDHGRIVERGRHQDLLANAGPYRRMWDLQRCVLADLPG